MARTPGTYTLAGTLELQADAPAGQLEQDCRTRRRESSATEAVRPGGGAWATLSADAGGLPGGETQGCVAAH